MKVENIAIPQCVIDYIIATPQGERNNRLFDAICMAKHLNHKATPEDLFRKAKELNQLFNETQTELPDNEVKDIVTSVFRNQYTSSCWKFKDHCPGVRKCALFSHTRKPIDFTSVSFKSGKEDYVLSFYEKRGMYVYTIYKVANEIYEPQISDLKTKEKPDNIPERSNLRAKLRSILLKDYSKERANEEEMKLLLDLKDKVEKYFQYERDLQKAEEALQAELELKKIDEGRKALTMMRNPIIEIGSIIDWLQAGERINVLFAFCCYLHQIIYEEPINLFAVGPSGSGKTVIVNTALKLIPREFIRNEKKPSPAAMIRRSEEDPYYYEGCIVNYGDLGGKMDMENSEEVRNIIKELNSEGFVNRPVAERNAEGGFTTRDITLFGRPTLTYTTVHETEIDDQEVSRGFVISPRDDNRFMANRMEEYIDLGGRTAAIQQVIINREVPLLQAMVLHLKENRTMKVINPYMPILRKWIQNSPFIKRDYPKIIRLAKVVTMLNHQRRHTYLEDGTRCVVTHPEDIIILYQMVRGYLGSIELNLPESVLRTYEDVKKHFPEEEFTVSDLRAKTKDINTKRLGNILYELKNRGLLHVAGKDGKSNLYILGKARKLPEVNLDDFKLTEAAQRMIAMEHSPELLEVIEAQNKDVEHVNIHTWASDRYFPPPWEYYEPRKEIKEVKLNKMEDLVMVDKEDIPEEVEEEVESYDDEPEGEEQAELDEFDGF